jgi:dodecin
MLPRRVNFTASMPAAGAARPITNAASAPVNPAAALVTGPPLAISPIQEPLILDVGRLPTDAQRPERLGPPVHLQGRYDMAESVYRVTEVVGVSSESWEAAARVAIETAAKSVRELRVAEVVRQDLTIQDGSVLNYRVRLGISFKYDPE